MISIKGSTREMINQDQYYDRKIYKSYNFWIIIATTLILISIYLLWPWRGWKVDGGVWSWFSWLSPLSELAIFELGHHILGILFLIPIIYASMVLSWPVSIGISLLSVAGLLPLMIDIFSSSSDLITNIVILLLPCLITSMISLELRSRRKNIQIYAERERERKIYMARVLEAQENERKRIAEELHDETIQTLLVMGNYAQNILYSKPNMNEIEKNAQYIKDAAVKAVEEFRRISRDLRPSILDDMGLVPALRWLIKRTSEENPVRTSFTVDGPECQLSPQMEINVFRIVQEALNNICRHARAEEAAVALVFNNGSLNIKIQDDGQGFYPQKDLSRFGFDGKLGLIGMRERVELLGGKLDIFSKPDEGTTILIHLNSDELP